MASPPEGVAAGARAGGPASLRRAGLGVVGGRAALVDVPGAGPPLRFGSRAVAGGLPGLVPGAPVARTHAVLACAVFAAGCSPCVSRALVERLLRGLGRAV